MRVVIAPDSFKGTVTAADAAAAIAAGWASVRPDDDLVLLPQADGGEGTVDAIAASTPDARWHSAGTVTGPDGRGVEGRWLGLPDGTAVVELAQMSGLPLMLQLDALGASTRGLGEVIRHAVDHGATALALALGGSASTDGGAGALRALGLRLLDEHGDELPEGGAALAHLARVDRTALLPLPPLTLLTDVSSPLLGPAGAAAVFGPQKGADEQDVRTLDAALARFAGVLGGDPEAPGMGAAGGTSYGFAAAWGADVRSGADAVAALTQLDEAITHADIVITGEGRFDSQSSAGKVCGRTLGLAGAKGRLVAGSILADPGVWNVALADIAGSTEAALDDAAHWLRVAGAAAAR